MLKAEDLDLMLSRKDRAACVNFFAGATEADRKAVCARARQWYEVGEAFRLAESPWVTAMGRLASPLPKRFEKALALVKEMQSGVLLLPASVSDKESLEVARLAVLASAGLTEARQVGLGDPQFAFAIMAQRRPRWLSRWLEFACAEQWYGIWEQVRQFETAGISTVDRADGYWLAMAVTLGQKEAGELIEYLGSESELLESLIWRMLENEQAVRALCDPTSISQRLQSRSATDRNFDFRSWAQRTEEWRRASYIWKSALIEMAHSGQIESERLLVPVFTWIARLAGDGESRATVSYGQATSPSAWFHSIHDELNLTRAQKGALVNKYIGLLTARDSATLSFALKNLREAPGEALPFDDLLGNLACVFSGKRKGPALEALKFLEELACENPGRLSQASRVALNGFEHPSKEVHERTLSFLKRTKALEDAAIALEMQERLSLSNILVKKKAHEITGVLAGEQDCRKDEDLAARAASCLETARHLSGALLEEAGIAQAIAAVEGTAGLPACLSLQSPHIPRLDADKRIVPLNDLDDLIYLFLQVLEGAASADDVERLLDALLRLCHLRPPDFESRVSALAKKAGQTSTGMENQFAVQPFSGVNPLSDLAGLARAWISGTAREPGLLKPFLESIGFNADLHLPGPLAFFSERVLCLSRLVARRQPLPLLAAPTHQGGWIDPCVVPDRLSQWRAAGIKPDKCDFIQMLLRLAPDARAEALALIGKDESEYASTLRYALGGEEKLPLRTAEIAVAAFRCREPRGSSRLLAQKYPWLGPDSAVPATYKDNLEAFARRPDNIFGTLFENNSSYVLFESEPPLRQRAGLRLFPLELLHNPRVSWDTSGLLELFFPADRESYLAYQTRRMAVFLESQGDYWKGSWDCIFDSDTAAAGMGAWLIALALSAKQAEVSRLATDAMIACIEDCRLDGATFGIVLARLFGSGKITLSRWITALKDTARISPLHLHFVILSLEKFIGNRSLQPGKSLPLPALELLLETATAAGFPVSDQGARAYLGGIEGKGKGARLARLLLDLQPGREASHLKEVSLQMLESRIKRQERWQSRIEARKSCCRR